MRIHLRSVTIALSAVIFVSLLSMPAQALGGSIAAWGRNDDGQITAPDGSDFVVVDAGGYHGLAQSCSAVRRLARRLGK